MYRLPMDAIENGNTLLGDIDLTLHGDPILVDGVRGKALSSMAIISMLRSSPHTYVLNVDITRSKF